MLGLLLTLLSQNFLFFALHFESSAVFPRPLSAKEERACFERLSAGDRSARDELVAAAGSVSVEMSPAMIDEHFADGTESSDISYEDTAVDYEDEEKIKEILTEVDSGVIYDQNSALPFKDFSHYCNVTVHMEDDYYNTRIFVIHEDALPGFVKEDFNKR